MIVEKYTENIERSLVLIYIRDNSTFSKYNVKFKHQNYYESI